MIALPAPLAPVTQVCPEPGPGIPQTSSGHSVALASRRGKNQGLPLRFVSLLCDFGQVTLPLWASLFSYPLPCLHHQSFLEARRGKCQQFFPLYSLVTEDSSSNHPPHFSLYVLSPLPGHPSLFLMVSSSSLRSSSETTSSRQASCLGRIVVCLSRVGSLMRVRTYSWPSLCAGSQSRAWLSAGLRKCLTLLTLALFYRPLPPPTPLPHRLGLQCPAG